MAADMTDETIAQYMERIEKMSIKEIQKEIEFLESPGYNCEGLVCADGVIVPRTRMLRKVLWEKKTSQKSLTALQWAKEGYVVNPDATGTAWKNNSHNFKATYIYIMYQKKFMRIKKQLKSFLNLGVRKRKSSL